MHIFANTAKKMKNLIERAISGHKNVTEMQNIARWKGHPTAR